MVARRAGWQQPAKNGFWNFFREERFLEPFPVMEPFPVKPFFDEKNRS
jgi:hypothetical protein